MIKVYCTGYGASAECDQWLTSGSVGMQAHFSFDSVWDGLGKTAVFIAGDVQRDVLLTGDTCKIPWEVLENPGVDLIVGVYGSDGDALVIPTVYANVGRIRRGAAPSGDEGEDPTPTLVEQIMAAAGMAVETANSVREDADNGVFNGEPGPKGESGFAATAVSTVDNSANQFTEPGLYYFDESHTLSDAPSQGKIGFLSVMAEGHTTKQEWKPSNTNDMYSRRNYDVSLNVWRDWARVNTFPPLNKSSDLGESYHLSKVAEFVRKMNKKAAELGMGNTEYKTPSGYPSPSATVPTSTAYNSHSTVVDTMRLLVAARHTPEVYSTMGKHYANFEIGGNGYLYNHSILMNVNAYDGGWRKWESDNGFKILAAKGGSLLGPTSENGNDGILNYAMLVDDGTTTYAVVIFGLADTSEPDGGDRTFAKKLTLALIHASNGVITKADTDEIDKAVGREHPVGMGVVKLVGDYDGDIAAINGGVYYNQHKSYVTASVAKMMTALLVAENSDNHFVTISDFDCVGGGSDTHHIVPGDTTTIADLLSIMLVTSDNSAATALAKNCSSALQSVPDGYATETYVTNAITSAIGNIDTLIGSGVIV